MEVIMDGVSASATTATAGVEIEAQAQYEPERVVHVQGGGGGGGSGKIPSGLGRFMTQFVEGTMKKEIIGKGNHIVVLHDRYLQLEKALTEEINNFMDKKEEFLRTFDTNDLLVIEMFNLLENTKNFSLCREEEVKIDGVVGVVVAVVQNVLDVATKGCVETNYETATREFNEIVNRWVRGYVNFLLSDQLEVSDELKTDIVEVFKKFSKFNFPLDTGIDEKLFTLRKKFEIESYLTYGDEILAFRREAFIKRFNGFFNQLFKFYSENNFLEVDFTNVHLSNPLEGEEVTLNSNLREEERDRGYLERLQGAKCFMSILHVCKDICKDFTDKEINESSALQLLKQLLRDSTLQDVENLSKCKTLWPRLFGIQVTTAMV